MAFLEDLGKLFGFSSSPAGVGTPSAQSTSGEVPEAVKTIFGMPEETFRQRIRAIGAGMANLGDTGGDPYVAAARGFGGATKYFQDQEEAARKQALLDKQQAQEDTRWREKMDFDKTMGERRLALEERRLAGGGGDELGLNLVYGQDANGNLVGFQVSKSGGLRPVQLPEGVKLTPGTSTVDLGPEIGIRDNKSGQIVDRLPKDISGAARQSALGKAQAEAQQQLGGARQIASHVSQQIESLKSDPNLPDVLGAIDSRTPNILPGAVRAQTKIDQVQASAFMQGYQMLKGGGAITEVEGLKAERAMARLNQAQSEADFKAALDEFNDAVQAGVRKLEAAAGTGISNAGPGVSGEASRNGRTQSGVSWSIED